MLTALALLVAVIRGGTFTMDSALLAVFSWTVGTLVIFGLMHAFGWTRDRHGRVVKYLHPFPGRSDPDDALAGPRPTHPIWMIATSGTGREIMGVMAGKPEKQFVTKGAERVLAWSFLIPIILLVGTFIVLAIAR